MAGELRCGAGVRVGKRDAERTLTENNISGLN